MKKKYFKTPEMRQDGKLTPQMRREAEYWFNRSPAQVSKILYDAKERFSNKEDAKIKSWLEMTDTQ